MKRFFRFKIKTPEGRSATFRVHGFFVVFRFRYFFHFFKNYVVIFFCLIFFALLLLLFFFAREWDK